MTYFAAILLSLGLFALVIVWSLIEISLESRKNKRLDSKEA